MKYFTRYAFAEQADIRAGQTFSVTSDAPVYRVAEDEGVQYDASSLFNNPYGYWRLELTSSASRSAPAKRSWWKLRKQ